MTDSLVSIIIPVYNNEQFIEKCLNSLVNQTYRLLEIIVIDDGSTDSSGDISDEFAQRNKTIKVVHKKNEGVSLARIDGFALAKGDYVCFIDADDYVDDKYVEILLNKALETSADIICCQNYIVRSGSIVGKTIRSVIGVFNKDQIRNLLNTNYLWDKTRNLPGISLYVTCKLFKRAIIGDSLKKGIGLWWGEDIVTNIDIMDKVSRICVLDDALYYHVYHSRQASSKPLPELWNGYMQAFKAISVEYDEKGYFKTQLPDRIWYNIVKFTKQIYHDNGFKTEKVSSFLKSVLENELIIAKVFDNPLFRPYTHRLFYSLIKHNRLSAIRLLLFSEHMSSFAIYHAKVSVYNILRRFNFIHSES